MTNLPLTIGTESIFTNTTTRKSVLKNRDILIFSDKQKDPGKTGLFFDTFFRFNAFHKEFQTDFPCFAPS